MVNGFALVILGYAHRFMIVLMQKLRSMLPM